MPRRLMNPDSALEVGVEPARLEAHAVAPAGAVERRLPQRRGRRAVAAVGAAGGALQQQAVHLLPHQARVGADHAIRSRAVDAVGVDHRHLRRRADVALRPQDVEHRMVFPLAEVAGSSTAIRYATLVDCDRGR